MNKSVLSAGVPGAETIKRKLDARLAEAKRIIGPILALPRSTYFTEPGNLMNSEHKAIIQVSIVSLSVQRVHAALTSFTLVSERTRPDEFQLVNHMLQE